MLKRRCTQRGDAAGTSYSAFLVSCSAWTIHPCRVSHSGENSIRAECCDLPGGGGEEEVGRKNWACSNADASVKRSFVVHRRRRRRLHTHTHTQLSLFKLGRPQAGGRGVTLSRFRLHWIQRESFLLEKILPFSSAEPLGMGSSTTSQSPCTHWSDTALLNVAVDSVLVALFSTHATLTKVKVGWERSERAKSLGSGDRSIRARRRNSKIERQLRGRTTRSRGERGGDPLPLSLFLFTLRRPRIAEDTAGASARSPTSSVPPTRRRRRRSERGRQRFAEKTRRGPPESNLPATGALTGSMSPGD